MKSFFHYYFQTRGFAYKTLANFISNGRKKPLDPNLPQNIDGMFSVLYELEKYPNLSLSKSDMSQLCGDESNFLEEVYKWYINGKITYRFSKSLTDLLIHTDVLDQRFDISSLPYESLFIDFDNAEVFHKSVSNNSSTILKLNGILVNKNNDRSITISISLRDPQDLELHTNWTSRKHPLFIVVFSKPIEGDEDLSIGELLKLNLEANLDVEKYYATKESFPGRQIAVNSANDILKEYSALLFNSLNYLTTDKPDVVNRPTPLSRQNALNRIQSPQRKVFATLDLLRDGHYKFLEVGESFNTSHLDLINSGGGFLEKKRHWRRGHWRNQHIGQKDLNMQKLIWIRPTIIRADRSEDPISGKIFSVD